MSVGAVIERVDDLPSLVKCELDVVRCFMNLFNCPQRGAVAQLSVMWVEHKSFPVVEDRAKTLLWSLRWSQRLFALVFMQRSRMRIQQWRLKLLRALGWFAAAAV
jgi:hypothetical protein